MFNKKIIIPIFTFVIMFFYAWPVMAQENIDDFRVEIKILSNASLEITESITYNFGENERHGIFRDIPYSYNARGGKFKLRFSDIAVFNEKGEPYKFEISKQNGNKNIKIGDANTYVSGKKIYNIKYTVERAINFFESHDELYWNVSGNDWPVTISQIKADVKLPSQINEASLKTECYAGRYASQDDCVSTRYEYSGEGIVKEIVFINDRLNSGEGMTIVVGIPKGAINKPPLWKTVLNTVQDNWILILPLLVLAVMYHLWNQHGRDPKGRGTIIAQYEAPDNLTPAEIGTIIDDNVDHLDVSADIIHLAVNGYLKIERNPGEGILKKTDYTLYKLKDGSDLVNQHEQLLFKALFAEGVKSIKLSKLKNKFYKDLAEIKKSIFETMKAKDYYTKNPSKVRNKYMIIGVLFFVASGIIGGNMGALGVISFVLSGLIVIVFGFIMPAKTWGGALAKEHILGLKDYLKVAEKDRLKFHNAPEKNPKHFEALLPFAMVLKVEKDWAAQFEDIYDQQPSWYTDPTHTHFRPLVLAGDLSSFQAKANTTLSSQPSSAGSGGSGFSGGGVGGGFGGGGGGSW